MNDVLLSFLRRFVLVFFDDILIYSSSWSEHLQHVRLVLIALCTHDLLMHPAQVGRQRLNKLRLSEPQQFLGTPTRAKAQSPQKTSPTLEGWLSLLRWLPPPKLPKRLVQHGNIQRHTRSLPDYNWATWSLFCCVFASG